MKKVKLIPPDKKQCQAEILEGSFMTLGPRRYVRCASKAVYIAKENKPNSDGQRGSMSLCDDCLPKMTAAYGLKYATVRRITKP